MPFLQIFDKIKERLVLQRNRLFRHCNIEKISMYGYAKFESSEPFDNWLHNILGYITHENFIGIREEEKRNIIFLANQTLKNYFNYLGSGWIEIEPLRWNVDKKNGHAWPDGKYYMELKGIRGEGCDIKFPWELSRGHHLLWLGEAYLITGEEKYAEKIVFMLNNWIDNNPLMYTVNWTCSMDVAIRAVNWMYAINMISGSASFTEAFSHKVSKSLYQHGFFISHNLEKSVPWSNNHYTSDLVGLLYLGALFLNTKNGRSWFKFAKKEFYAETRKQMLPSGVHYEKSTSYHRLMVELTSYPLSMLTRIGETIPKDIVNTTQKMYDYVGTYIKPNGSAPLLADNDDGRFLPFTYGEFRNHRYLLDSGGMDQVMINNGIKSLFNLCSHKQGKFYEDAGIAIIKEEGVYLMVNNSGYSRNLEPGKKRIGTHTHNDQLSFEFSIGEEDIIIDPGTYLYTSSITDRNEFRCTRKHNTVIVDGEEQNILSETNAFAMEINNVNRKLSVNSSICKGGYETLRGKLKHERQFKVCAGQLEIVDILVKEGKGHYGKIYYHLDENVLPKLMTDGTVNLSSQCHDIVMTFHSQGTYGHQGVKIVEDTLSPSYGVLKNTSLIEMDFMFDNKCTVETKIEWK